MEQEITLLKSKGKLKESSLKLDEIMATYKTPKDKGGLGFEASESSRQKIEDNEKVENTKTKKNINEKTKGKHLQNENILVIKPLVRKPNAQRYPCFNGYFLFCNKFIHKAID